MTTINQDIGKRIKALRNKHKLTQRELAKQLGKVSNVIISHIEQGKQKLSAAQAIQLCEIFDTTLDYLLLGLESTPKTYTAYRPQNRDTYISLTQLAIDHNVYTENIFITR